MESFENPGVEQRSLLFWAWNDTLEAKELERQITLLKEAGCGGFFMHSRFGLESPYLGKQWDEAVLLTAKQAQKEKLEAWVYDEDRWPSGCCGGKVQQDVGGLKGLTIEVSQSGTYTPEKQVLALFQAIIDGDAIISMQRLSTDKTQKAPEGYRLLIIREEQGGPSPWFNGFPPPDNLAPASEQEFLRLTHQHYADLFHGDMPKMVKGFFTDEPSLYDRHSAFDPKRGWLPWTDGLADWMQSEGNFDVLSVSPYLFFNAPESEKVRHDYWRMIALRYEQCYSGQIAAWCEAHGVRYTGHFLQEDKLGLCNRVNGSIMPHYSHEWMPGIDNLGERTEEYLTVKQCASVSAQYGKHGVIVETYAGTGWDFTFQGQKWVADWEYALGVTRRCQHLMLYSLRGCRKRDYPPSFNYQSPWWGVMKMVEDYFARVALVLQRGKAWRDLLLIHPMTTSWMHMGCSPYGNPVRRDERDVPAMDAYGYRLNALIKSLMAHHYDHELGDETIIERIGCIKEGAFIIGACSYHVVVLPSLENVERPTLHLLKAFKEQGGNIIVLEPAPRKVDGEESEEAKQFFHDCLTVKDEAALLKTLEQCKTLRPVRIKENGEECQSILLQVRSDDKHTYLFLANNDKQNGHHLTIESEKQGKVVKLDAETGKQSDVLLDETQPTQSWTAEVSPCGSLLYEIEEEVAPQKTESKHRKEQTVVAVDGDWDVTLDSENVLLLDRCKASLSGEPYSAESDVWRMQETIRKRLGMVTLRDDEIAQRYTWDTIPHKHDGKLLSLEFTFKTDVEKALKLAVEGAEQFTIAIDGSEKPNTPSGWFIDRSLDVVPLGTIKAGNHILTLTCAYTNAMELENCFIIGSFGVTENRVIVEAPKRLSYGDWTKQGLFHYPGNVSYHKKVTLAPWKGLLFLQVPEYDGTCMRCTLNGVSFDVPWRDGGKVDVSQVASVGENELTVTVYGSLRNMYGPFHLPERPEICGPGAFTPDTQDDAYHVVPYGLSDHLRFVSKEDL